MPTTMAVRLTRGRALLLAALALVLAVPVVRAQAQLSPIDCEAQGRVKQSGNWQVFDAPTFLTAEGIPASADVVDYAVDPRAPSRVLMASATTVYLSEDGGCGWEPSLQLPAAPDPALGLSGLNTRVVSVDFSFGGRGLATFQETVGTTRRPHVAYSDSVQQGTWRPGDGGLPPIGRPVKLALSPGGPNTAYLALAASPTEVTGGTPLPGGLPIKNAAGVLYRSQDHGQNWSLMTDTADLQAAGVTEIQDIAANPSTPSELWLIANGKLKLSQDSGQTLASPSGLNQSGLTFTTVLDTGARNGARVFAFTSNSKVAIMTAHKQWSIAKAPGAVQSATYRRERGQLRDIAVATSPSAGTVRIYRSLISTNPRWSNIGPSVGLGMDFDIAASGVDLQTWFGQNKRSFLRYAERRDPGKGLPPPPKNRGVNDPPVVRGRLSPQSTNIEMRVGERKTVNYTLDLPRSPTPLDLFLLVDSSQSMNPTIAGLQKGLFQVASEIAGAGINVRIGVGRINVYEEETLPGIGGGGRPLYERLRTIGYVDQELYAAIDSLSTAAGSGQEAQLESLYQMATGEGLAGTVNGIPVPGQSRIPAGQQAKFRNDPEILRVVFHATDEVFSNPTAQDGNDEVVPGTHTFDQTVQALRNARVIQIGLSQGSEASRPYLERMARATGALAPPGGIDCGGDGSIDIPAGAAIVCGSAHNLDLTLIDILQSLTDVKPVTIEATKSPVLGGISRTKFDVNVKKASRMTFAVTYTCVNVTPGIYEVNIAGVLRNASVALAGAQVTCGLVPGQPPPPPEVPIPAEQPPAPPAQPQPAPPVINVNPVPQTQPQLNPNVQANVQGGAATQEQEQPQLATVWDEVDTDEDTQFAMSGLHANYDHDANAAMVTVAAGLMASACVGTALARRRVRTATARIHR